MISKCQTELVLDAKGLECDERISKLSEDDDEDNTKKEVLYAS
jgi:hypothetical protein